LERLQETQPQRSQVRRLADELNMGRRVRPCRCSSRRWAPGDEVELSRWPPPPSDLTSPPAVDHCGGGGGGPASHAAARTASAIDALEQKAWQRPPSTHSSTSSNHSPLPSPRRSASRSEATTSKAGPAPAAPSSPPAAPAAAVISAIASIGISWRRHLQTRRLFRRDDARLEMTTRHLLPLVFWNFLFGHPKTLNPKP